MSKENFSDEFYNCALQLSDLMESKKSSQSNSCLVSSIDSKYFYLVTIGKYKKMELPIVTGGKNEVD